MKRLVLLGLAAAAVLAPFTAAPPAQAMVCDELTQAFCTVAGVACTVDDTLYNKSAVYRKYGPSIECLM